MRKGNRGTDAVNTAPIVIAACAELDKAGFREGQPATDKWGYWYMFDADIGDIITVNCIDADNLVQKFAASKIHFDCVYLKTGLLCQVAKAAKRRSNF